MIHCIVADKPVVVPLLEHLEKARNDAIVRDTNQMGVLFPEHGRRLLQSVVRDLDKEVVDLMGPDVVHLGRDSIHFKNVTKIITKNITKNAMKNLSKSYNKKFKKSVVYTYVFPFQIGLLGWFS